MDGHVETTPSPAPDSPVAPAGQTSPYVPPSIERLGTLAELTRGGDVGPDDGLGGAGDGGSL